MTSLLMSSLPISTLHRLFRCRYSTSRDVVVSSPSSSRAPRRVCSQASKTLLLKSTSINIFVLLMLRPTFHATPEKLCAPGFNEALRAEFLRFRNNTVLQNSKRSKTFKRMCVSRDVVTLSPLLPSTSAVCGFLALLLANPKKQLEGQKLPSPGMNS